MRLSLYALAVVAMPAVAAAPPEAATCNACHVAEISARQPDVPNLNGQLIEYLELQLRNYQSGERKSLVMEPLAKTLTAKQIETLATYYASEPARSRSAGGSPNPLGNRVYDQGNVDNGVAACAWCHGKTGAGLAPAFPRLASQSPQYVRNQLKVFQTVADFGNPYAWVMKAAVVRLSDDEAAAVAEYLQTLP